MQMDIRSVKVDMTDAIRKHVEQRFAFTTRRFSRLIHELTIRLEDSNGPRGGADKACRVHVHMRPHEILLIEETNHDLYAAIDRAASRLKQTLGRRANRLPHAHARPHGRRPFATSDVPAPMAH